MRKVLIADDDQHIREVISFSLRKALFETFEVENGIQVLERFDDIAPDVVILDIGMPEMEGTDVCRQLRAKSNVPIIFVSAKDSEFDRVLGLELGGDDYLPKPFSPRELVARVKSLIRRSSFTKSSYAEKKQYFLQHGNLSLNVQTYIVCWQENTIDLTSTEFKIVQTLLQHPGRVCSRDALMDGAYPNNVSASDRTIDSHLRRIRKKFRSFDATPIETIHGVGYKLNDCD